MLAATLAFFQVTVFADPVDEALSSFARLGGYRVTLRSSAGEVIRYSFKKPGYIRMEFEKPHKGAVLVYDPFKKEALLRPFGFLKSLEMRMGPQDRLIRSSSGHTVDESDIGSLLRNVKTLKENGSIEAAGQEKLGGRDALVAEVRGIGGFEVDGISRYRLWLDKTLMLPLKVEAYSRSGELLEGVLMDDIETDPAFPADFFK
ncbi:hypothetical protein BAC1_01694 [uncultured bacterium]|nr:hypothetical protein BAC1_01694 [uncultured bacterium]